MPVHGEAVTGEGEVHRRCGGHGAKPRFEIRLKCGGQRRAVDAALPATPHRIVPEG